jgi:hypothetical protein
LKAKWEDPVYREKMRNSTFERTDEWRAVLSMRSRERWKDPVYRLSVETAIRNYFTMRRANGENIIVTGHSLGGGLARLVGALTNIQSVTFAPPGIRMSYRKYSTTAPDGSQIKIVSNDLHGQSVAVVTEYDWVSLVDEQVALVQKISCDKPESGMFMACHLIEGTICHLINNCGDDRFDGCDYDFDVTEGYNQAKIHLSNYIDSNKEVARMYRLFSFSGYFFLVYILVTIFVSIMYLF